MAKSVGVVLTGDRELNAKLAKLKATESKKIIRQASRTAIKPLLPAVKLAAPRRSGALGKSMVVRALRRSRKRVGVEITTRDGMFKGKQFYGGFQEWGWLTGSRTGKTRHTSVNPLTGKIEIERRAIKRTATYDQVSGKLRVSGKRRKIKGKRFIKATVDRRRDGVLISYREDIAKRIEDFASVH